MVGGTRSRDPLVSTAIEPNGLEQPGEWRSVGGGGSPGVGCWPEVASLVAVEGCGAAWWASSPRSWLMLSANAPGASGQGARSANGTARGEGNGGGTSCPLWPRGTGPDDVGWVGRLVPRCGLFRLGVRNCQGIWLISGHLWGNSRRTTALMALHLVTYWPTIRQRRPRDSL